MDSWNDATRKTQDIRSSKLETELYSVSRFQVITAVTVVVRFDSMMEQWPDYINYCITDINEIWSRRHPPDTLIFMFRQS